MLENQLFKCLLFLITVSGCLCIGCDQKTSVKPVDEHPVDTVAMTLDSLENVSLIMSKPTTDKGSYNLGQSVRLSSVAIYNLSDHDLKIDSIYLEVGTSSTNAVFVADRIFLSDVDDLLAGDSILIPDEELLIDTEDLQNRGYLVSLCMQLSLLDEDQVLSQEYKQYLTFFRISSDEDKLVFNIEQDEYMNMPVYRLKGGLSAEYAVQKSVASMTAGISHSWEEINPPRLSSPDFLTRSLSETVSTYDRAIGEFSKIETVIISTGITPISYISRAMNAPVLPLHFLVGAHTIKEVQTILDHTALEGVPAYATYGHDYSLSEEKGVAWIKLLDLPEQYLTFLKNHEVENVVFFGATASGGGEKAARQVNNGRADLEGGSIYLMYFAGGQAEGYLKRVIRDFDKDFLGPLINIADWESGIISDQIDQMVTSMKAISSIRETVLISSSIDDVHLWDLASHSMLKFFRINNIEPKGISLNPYLAGHPFYESYMGYIPFNYFNSSAIPTSFHMNRIDGMLSDAFSSYFPMVDMRDMEIIAVLGTSSGFYQALTESGYDRFRSLPNEDIWDLSDGKSTASELRAENILAAASASDLLEWSNGLTYLGINDLKEVADLFDRVYVRNK